MKSLAQLTRSPDALPHQVESRLPGADASRYLELARTLEHRLGVSPNRPVFLVSAPGRAELAGNHTDHNRGKVLAASVQLDSIAIVAPRDDMEVRLASEGYDDISLDLTDLTPRTDEKESTAALVRGVASAIAAGNGTIGGFDIAISSRVASGSGLSSSASVEVLIGTAIDHYWNHSSFGPVGVARAGQVAENQYFGKPSGLMDQVACAHGGIVFIDFRDAGAPGVESIPSQFESGGLSLVVVHTGGSHADLTQEYAAIPDEMRSVARKLDGTELADTTVEALVQDLRPIRAAVGDRAVARSLHFFAENERVQHMVEALRAGDMRAYAQLMNESGRSSAMYLQNSAPAGHPREQPIVIALALTEHFFAKNGLTAENHAACRVQGGGFAGTIQILLPSDRVESYREFMADVFCPDAVTPIQVRNTGAIAW